MHTDLVHALAEAGIEATSVTPMKAGLGSASLWRIERAKGLEPLVARVFEPASDAAANRERAAMEMAHRHGVPVPEIVYIGVVSSHPTIITTFARGTLARDLLLQHPERAREIGEQIGAALGRLHTVTAPDALRSPQHQWIDRGGVTLEPIRPQLDALPHADRLVHLDFHPANAFVNDIGVSAIIDWENATAAPPHLDVARSRTILHAIALAGGVPKPLADTLAEALTAGHASIMGQDPHQELSDAWALAMTAADLESHLDSPDATIGRDVVTTLRTDAERLVEAIRATN